VRVKIVVARAVGRILSLVLPPQIMKAKSLFSMWEKRGYHVTPVHFYEPIPDTRQLGDETWSRESELVGIDINEGGQLRLLDEFSLKWRDEYEEFPRERTQTPYQFYVRNGLFEAVDGEMLYCMIRHLRPRKIIEIGSGYSTYLSAQAILRNRQEDSSYECELVAIEPYPNKVLRTGFPGLSRLVVKEVQDVPLSEFMALGDGDILFIDSSHVLKIGSDVQCEYLEILPRLNKGVVIHVHDIFLPLDYSKEWVVRDHNFWNEQYLLQAFLIFNDHFEVLWAGNYMHLKYPGKLESAFGSYKRTEEKGRKSFWMRKIK
jgi:hypothetical protein